MHGKATALTEVFLSSGTKRVVTVANGIFNGNFDDTGYRRLYTGFGPPCGHVDPLIPVLAQELSAYPRMSQME